MGRGILFLAIPLSSTELKRANLADKVTHIFLVRKKEKRYHKKYGAVYRSYLTKIDFVKSEIAICTKNRLKNYVK